MAKTFNDVSMNLDKALDAFLHDYFKTQLKDMVAATQTTEPGFTPPLTVAPVKTPAIAADQIERAIEAQAWASAKPAEVIKKPEAAKITGSRFGLWKTAPTIGAHRDPEARTSKDMQDTTPKKRGP